MPKKPGPGPNPATETAPAEAAVVGSIVHFQPHPPKSKAAGEPLPPLAAIVTFATPEDFWVNVYVFGDTAHANTYVPNVPFSDTPQAGHWNWPPETAAAGAAADA